MHPRISLRSVVAVFSIALVATGCGQASQDDSTERNDDGEVVEGGDVGVFRLDVGDCIDVQEFLGGDDESVVEQVAGIPCDEPHTGEVVLVDTEFFADLDAFPGITEGSDQASATCIEALDTYTATDYDSSNLDFLSLVPTENSWSAIDDRGLICIGVTLDDELTDVIETTGSFRVPS